jgi:Flp pilus assembly pilin Flp
MERINASSPGTAQPNWLRDERGQTVTEYAGVLAVLVIALTGVVFALQGEIGAFINKVGTAVAGILP